MKLQLSDGNLVIRLDPLLASTYNPETPKRVDPGTQQNRPSRRRIRSFSQTQKPQS